MRRQNPCENTTVSGASSGPTSRTARSTPSGVVTTELRSASSSSKSSRSYGSSLVVRRVMDRATVTPASVPTAASPAAPANQPAFDFRSSGFGSLSLTFTRSAVRPDNPATRADDNLVVDGAQHFGPVLRGGVAVDAGPEKDRLVAVGDVAGVGAEVNDELVHADSADVRPQPAVDQYIHPSAQCAEHAVGVSDRQQRQCGV